MKRIWIKNGLIGIIIGTILDVIIFVIASGIGTKCIGDICGPTGTSSIILSPIISVLIWPAAMIQASLWRIVVLAIYYFIVGVAVGWIYRKIKNSSHGKIIK